MPPTSSATAAHAFGWWAKMVMLRDWRLCWILGILWELLEYSFQHILPNFHECWWGACAPLLFFFYYYYYLLLFYYFFLF